MEDTIEKKQFYDEYSSFNLQPGKEIKLGDSLYFREERVDLLPFALESVGFLTAMKDKSAEGEKAIGQELQSLLKKWEQQAGITMLLQKAMDYKKVPTVTHTGNEWKPVDGGEEISNMVYRMTVRIYTQTSYDRTLKKSLPVAWYVSWRLMLNVPRGLNSKTIASQDRKRYTDKDSAEKYLDGRKAYYEHLFYKISPPIPEEYAGFFKVNGLLLPGYTIDGQELPVAEKSAAEVLEGLGGVFAPPQEKARFTLDGEIEGRPQDSPVLPKAQSKNKPAKGQER